MSKTKIESWLPLFPGYYETVFDNTAEDMRYVFTQEELDFIEEHGDKYTDAAELAIEMVDWNKCEELKSKRIVNAVGDLLKEENLISDIEYNSTYNPKEYNFKTDSINVTYTFTEENRQEIIDIILGHWNKWEQDIKDKFTSRDGFISFHSNDANDKSWELGRLFDNKDGCKIGIVLEFILKLRNYNVEAIYYHPEYDNITPMLDAIVPKYSTKEKRMEYIKQVLDYEEEPDPLEEIGYYNPSQLELFNKGE